MKVEDHARSSVARRLIRRYTTSIALERAPVISDGAGGRTRGPIAVLLPKDRYFAPAASPPILGIDALGRRLEERHVLLSVAGDDIKAGDEFMHGGHRYQVEHIVEDYPELVARVVRISGG